MNHPPVASRVDATGNAIGEMQAAMVASTAGTTRGGAAA